MYCCATGAWHLSHNQTALNRIISKKTNKNDVNTIRWNVRKIAYSTTYPIKKTLRDVDSSQKTHKFFVQQVGNFTINRNNSKFNLHWNCWISFQWAKIPLVYRRPWCDSVIYTPRTWTGPKMWGTKRMGGLLQAVIAFFRFYLYMICKCWWQPLERLTRHWHAAKILNLIPMECQTVAIASSIETCPAMWRRTLVLNPTYQNHSPRAGTTRRCCTFQSVKWKNWREPSKRWNTFEWAVLIPFRGQIYCTNRMVSMALCTNPIHDRRVHL